MDLEATEGDPRWHLQMDIRKALELKKWGLLIGHPPCTDTALSGARWFKEKRADGRQQAAVDFFRLLWESGIPRICLEQPMSVISSLVCKRTQEIQPWQFGHGERKTTWLWLKNLPPLQPTRVVTGRVPRVHHEPPGPDRQKNRSRTYPGIARAMAKQWGPLVADDS